MSYFLCNAAALQASLTKSTFTVYQYLAKSADNKTRSCYKKVKTIATKCGLSDRTVQRATKELVEKGLLEIKKQFLERGIINATRGKQINNFFILKDISSKPNAKYRTYTCKTGLSPKTLTGTEIKSIRLGKASLVDTFCYFTKGELWVKHMNIADYFYGSYNNHTARRERRLLLNKKELEKLIAAQAKKSGSKNSTYKLTPEEKLISDDFAKNRGKLPWPVEQGFVSEKFGVNVHPVFKQVKLNNAGITITTSRNADVRAVFKGVVTEIMFIPGDNNVVIVRHGNYLTVYPNLVEIFIKKGDTVNVKQKIGKLAVSSGNNSTLNFQVWRDKDNLDPQLWLTPW